MVLELYKNALVSMEEAQNYFGERFDSDEWFVLSEDIQEKLIISASKKINHFDFVGCVLEEDQPMAFPRNYEIPQDIKDAVCEEAFAMAQCVDDVHIKNQEKNIASISLGAGSVSYSGSSNDYEQRLLSKTAEYLVRKWTKKGYFMEMI